MKGRGWQWLTRVVRWSLSGVLIYAGVSKIPDPRGFSHAIANYRLLPELIIPWVGWLLPWVEVVVGFSVLTRIFYRGGLVWMGILFTGFLVALLWAYLHGLDIECGCFGTSGSSQINLLHIQLVALAWLFSLGLLWQQWRVDHVSA